VRWEICPCRSPGLLVVSTSATPEMAVAEIKKFVYKLEETQTIGGSSIGVAENLKYLRLV